MRRGCCALAGWVTVVVLAGLLGGTSAGGGIGTTGPAMARVVATGDVTVVHDPEIATEDGVHYLYSTGPGLPIRRSTDGVHWTLVGRAFAPESLPPWATTEVPGAVDPWAPALEWFGGTWHLYYSVSRFGETDSAIGHATSATLDPSHPDFGWVDHGPIVTSEAVPLAPGTEAPWNAIDPAVALDGDRVWLVWGSFQGGIKLRELDPATGALAEHAPVHTLARRVPWYFGVEGAHLEHRDGWWYLITSWNFCCRGVDSNYEVRVGRSRSITGPFVDQAGVALADGGGTLLLAGYGDLAGPGHSSVLREDDQWVLVHHFYDRAAGGTATLGLHRLSWTGDGWPTVGAQPSEPTTTEPTTTEATSTSTTSTPDATGPATAGPSTAGPALAAPRFTG